MSRTLLLLPIVLIAACGSDPITCGSPADASGSWNYTGDQSFPSAALSGTMTLTRTGTCTLQGTLSLTITGSGSPISDAGPVAVLFLDDTTIDLNAQVQGERSHVGEWHGDTISGTWTLTSGGASSGNFKMVRGGTP